MTDRSPFVSARARLALAAVVAIATAPATKPLQAADLSALLGLGRRALEPDLQSLVRAGVLRGLLGRRGGYGLARPAREIGVGTVVRVAESLRPGQKPPLPALVGDVVDAMLDFPSRRFAEALDAITLADLVERAANRARAA